MARLTLSPPIPEPLPANLGGTGIANAAASTLTLSSAGTLNLNGGTVAGTSGKTLTFNNTLTLAGTDSTTMTFPTTNATIARTDAGQTFTGANTFSGAETIALTAGANTTALTISNSGFTGSGSNNPIMLIKSSNITGQGSMLQLEHDTSTFSTVGAAIFLNMANGSGTFTVPFLYCANNGTLVNEITSAGQMAISLSGSGACIDLSGSSSATAAFKTSTNLQIATGGVHAATLATVPAALSSGTQTGWIAFALASGATHYLPYW